MRKVGLLVVGAAVAVVAGSGCSSDEIRPPFVDEKAAPADAIEGRIVVTTRGDVEYALAAFDAREESLDGIDDSDGARSPAYAPDGTRVAAASNANGRGAIQIFTRGEPDTVVEGSGYFDHPTWSPDGTQLAYAHHPADGTWDIYVVDLATGEAEALIDGDAQDWYPSWSPDGDTIAFTSDRDGDNAVWTVDMSTGELDKLVDSAGEDAEPSFSPDGETIVFASDRELNTWQIFTVPASGGEDTRLIRSDTVDRYPVYSPDGRYILVSTGYLAVYPADGGELPNGANRWKLVDELTFSATWTD